MLLLPPLPAAAKGKLAWEQWRHLPGAFDVAGRLPDGSLLVVTAKGLYQVASTGEASAVRADFTPVAGAEAYSILSAGLAVGNAGCAFPANSVYALKPSAPPAVLAVDLVTGITSTFAPIPGVDTLTGIAFDRSGRFGNRLVVIGPHAGQTVVDAIDCSGKVALITDSAPPMEGGMEVAPPTFGAFGGDLIVPDELSGSIIAVTPEGTTQVVARNGLPVGGDIGAESAGFVPRGFLQGGAAYLADRATANNPHAGTDTLLRLTNSELHAEGVTEGDLLVASEGGGDTVVVHCTDDGSCSSVRRLGQATAGAHVEGHLLVVADHVGPVPRPLPEGKLGAASRGGYFVYLPYAIGIIILSGLYLLYRRQQSRRRR